jgi:hypothetical protein
MASSAGSKPFAAASKMYSGQCRTVSVPSKDRLQDLQINIQPAIAGIYGCVDNLAWVWGL